MKTFIVFMVLLFDLTTVLSTKWEFRYKLDKKKISLDLTCTYK